MAWRKEHSKHVGTVWVNGHKRVIRTSHNAKRPWFVSRSLMMLGDKRGWVRTFGSAEAAMRAADKAKRADFNI